MPEDIAANTAQREYWNTVAGPRWVAAAAFVERRTQPVTDLLLTRSLVGPGEKVVEIGCGTGAATVPLAEAVGERGEVLGVDISDPMLTAARKRIAQSGRGNISLVQADAQTHGFEPGRFDLIASRFGVMFFVDPVAAFRNLAGAVRPDGRLCFACWAPLADNPHWVIPYEVAQRHLGLPAPKPAHAPGPLAFSDPDYVRSVLGTAGFGGIEIYRETLDIVGASPEEEAEHACTRGPSGRLIDEKTPSEDLRRTIRREMAEAFAAEARGGALRLGATVFLVTAQRLRP